jgi:stress response protein SCP2
MLIIVQKGQHVDLTMKYADLSRIMVGLGWEDVIEPDAPSENGLSQPIDCDASVLLLNAENKLASKDDIVYFRNLNSQRRCVQHLGDNRAGNGKGDAEQILIDLNWIPASIYKLLFVVTIYECEQRNHDFSLIKNAFFRIVNLVTCQEIIRFNLKDEYDGKTALLIGEIYRDNSDWKFNAIGQGTYDRSLFQIAKRFTC